MGWGGSEIRAVCREYGYHTKVVFLCSSENNLLSPFINVLSFSFVAKGKTFMWSGFIQSEVLFRIYDQCNRNQKTRNDYNSNIMRTSRTNMSFHIFWLTS